MESLILALKDDNSTVVEETEKALVKIGVPAMAPLIPALKLENATLRGKAARVLGRIGDRHAIAPLSQALNDKNSEVHGALHTLSER
jgi:HEAT repeat protein